MPTLPPWLAAVVHRPGPSTLGRAAVFAPETGSTNRDAAALPPDDAPDGLVVVTDHQTAGRGRRGRTWAAPPGEALLVSLVLRRPLPPGRAGLVPLAAGLALADGLRRLLPGADVRLKWPNDVRVDGRKVAGLLVETAGTALVVGCGVNVGQTCFPPEIAPHATSLALAAGAPPDRGAVLAVWLDALDPLLALVVTAPDRLLARYTSALDGLGTEVALHLAPDAPPLVGTFAGVAADGALRLRHADGRETRHHAGDVSLRPPPAQAPAGAAAPAP